MNSVLCVLMNDDPSQQCEAVIDLGEEPSSNNRQPTVNSEREQSQEECENLSLDTTLGGASPSETETSRNLHYLPASLPIPAHPNSSPSFPSHHLLYPSIHKESPNDTSTTQTPQTSSILESCDGSFAAESMHEFISGGDCACDGESSSSEESSIQSAMESSLERRIRELEMQDDAFHSDQEQTMTIAAPREPAHTRSNNLSLPPPPDATSPLQQNTTGPLNQRAGFQSSTQTNHIHESMLYTPRRTALVPAGSLRNLEIEFENNPTNYEPSPTYMQQRTHETAGTTIDRQQLPSSANQNHPIQSNVHRGLGSSVGRNTRRSESQSPCRWPTKTTIGTSRRNLMMRSHSSASLDRFSMTRTNSLVASRPMRGRRCSALSSTVTSPSPTSPITQSLENFERKIREEENNRVRRQAVPVNRPNVASLPSNRSRSSLDDIEHKLHQDSIERQQVQDTTREQQDEVTIPAENMYHRPGAFSVRGPRTRSRRNIHQQFSPTNTPMQQPRPTVGATSNPVVAVAAMVVEDFEREELFQRAEQLRQQEAELAEKMAKLQQWEEELNRKRAELDHLSTTQGVSSSCIVQAEVVSSRHSSLSTRRIDDDYQQPLSPEYRRSRHSSHDRPYGSSADSFPSSSLEDSNIEGGTFVRGSSRAYIPPNPASVAHNIALVDLDEAASELGPGAMRFAPSGERRLDQQLNDMSRENRRAFYNILERWNERRTKQQIAGSGKGRFILPPVWHLRFLRTYCRKDGSFNEERAWSVEKRLRERFVVLNVYTLKSQLQSKTLFPVPGLKTIDGYDMFYMRPARYFPGKTSARTIIDNQCYVMNTMLEKEHAQTEGIGFIACMDDWKMSNFEVNYCYQFMMALQGFMIPVKTQLFLIVNPPRWFGIIWKIMKPMLAPSFRKRVKICNETKISKYLMPGFERFLPDDMQTGLADTDSIVSDFIAFREFAERDIMEHKAGPPEDSHSDGLHSDDLSLLAKSSSHSYDNRGYATSGRASQERPASCLTMSSLSEEGDNASIDADIDNEDLLEHDDMKPAATAELANRYMPGRRG